jgi:hypothetical protein
VDEAEWLACTDPTPMLDFLQGRASGRKLRLFAVACCRRIWNLLRAEDSRAAIATAERFADGLTRAEEWQATLALWDAYFDAEASGPEFARDHACHSLLGQDAFFAARSAARHAARATAFAMSPALAVADDLAEDSFDNAPLSGERAREQAAQVSLLRDVFGNPFRSPSPVPPAVLAWNDDIARRIAEGIYEERKLPEGTLDPAWLAILADALLDAGADDEELIRHCRGAGPHVRGCWAVDLILGKS